MKDIICDKKNYENKMMKKIFMLAGLVWDWVSNN